MTSRLLAFGVVEAQAAASSASTQIATRRRMQVHRRRAVPIVSSGLRLGLFFFFLGLVFFRLGLGLFGLGGLGGGLLLLGELGQLAAELLLDEVADGAGG